MNDRLTELEQRFTQLEDELDRTRQQLSNARRRSHRIVWSWRALGAATLAMIATGTTLAAASPGPQPLTVKAPFTVVDGSGQPIMQIANNGMKLSHHGISFMIATETGVGLLHDGKPLVGMVSTSGGGRLQVYGTGGEKIAGLGYDTQSGGSQLLVDAKGNSTTLGLHNGALGLRVYKGSQETAAFGETSNGNGMMNIYRPSGQPAAQLGTDSAGSPYLQLTGKSGNPSVVLAEHSRGGYLALANNAGDARVEGGVLAGDVGVVRAYGPGGFDFIMGRS